MITSSNFPLSVTAKEDLPNYPWLTCFNWGNIYRLHAIWSQLYYLHGVFRSKIYSFKNKLDTSLKKGSNLEMHIIVNKDDVNPLGQPPKYNSNGPVVYKGEKCNNLYNLTWHHIHCTYGIQWRDCPFRTLHTSSTCCTCCYRQYRVKIEDLSSDSQKRIKSISLCEIENMLSQVCQQIRA